MNVVDADRFAAGGDAPADALAEGHGESLQLARSLAQRDFPAERVGRRVDEHHRARLAVHGGAHTLHHHPEELAQMKRAAQRHAGIDKDGERIGGVQALPPPSSPMAPITARLR